MVLVNGAQGIGTGWSTTIPQYDPRQICQSILNKLNKGEFLEIHPHYKGFQGTITKNENGSYTTFGKI
jgi:DNA topoisomerase-2